MKVSISEKNSLILPPTTEIAKNMFLGFCHYFLQNRTFFLEIEPLLVFPRWPDDEKSPEMDATERDLNPQKKISFQLSIVAEKCKFSQNPRKY